MQVAKAEDPGNPTTDFRGQKRCHATHRSRTDPDSVLYRKVAGKDARLCFGGPVLMDNRHGLCADFTIHNPIAEPEPVVALEQVATVKALQRGAGQHGGCGPGLSPAGLSGRLPRAGSCSTWRPRTACRWRAWAGARWARRGTAWVSRFASGWRRFLGGSGRWGPRRSRYWEREWRQGWGYFVVASSDLLRMAPLNLAVARPNACGEPASPAAGRNNPPRRVQAPPGAGQQANPRVGSDPAGRQMTPLNGPVPETAPCSTACQVFPSSAGET